MTFPSPCGFDWKYETVRFLNKSGVSFRTSKHGDVGHDLFVDMTRTKQNRFDRFLTELIGSPVVVIWPFTNRAIASGIFLSMPNNIWAKVHARSSTAKKGMSVDGGIIDSGYRGEMFAVLCNNSMRPRVIRHGERYAQIIFHEAVRPTLEQVDFFELKDASTRGSDGFGSTGQ